MALFVTMIGLATFVSPLVETGSEVHEQTRWSPMQIILAIHAGALPLDHRMVRNDQLLSLGIDALFGVATVYLILILIAAMVAISPSERIVGSLAAGGAAMTLGEARWRYFDFQDAIYGAPSAFAGHQVHAGINCMVLLGVLLLLVFIVATRALDY